jgi:hypothetical protein
MSTPAEQVTTALCYVEHHQSFTSGDQRPQPRHAELFRSNHGRPSEGAKRMGQSEYETLPHRAMIVLAAEVIRLRSVAADLLAVLQYIEGRLPAHDTKSISQAKAAIAKATS